ncbi:hypothetical protein CLV88_110149, partial [Shimia abyssi]
MGGPLFIQRVSELVYDFGHNARTNRA